MNDFQHIFDDSIRYTKSTKNENVIVNRVINAKNEFMIFSLKRKIDVVFDAQDT